MRPRYWSLFDMRNHLRRGAGVVERGGLENRHNSSKTKRLIVKLSRNIAKTYRELVKPYNAWLPTNAAR